MRAGGKLAMFAVLLVPLFRPAAAQPAPAVTPLRDVVVTYRLDGEAPAALPGGLSGPVTLFWDAAGQRLRAEADGRTQIALIDLRARSGQAIDTALRIVLPLRIRARDLQPLMLDGVRLQPRGKERVAGLACSTYAFNSAQGPGTVCLTPDGVPLRGEGRVSGKPGRFTALQVRYSDLPADLFVVPPGYIAIGGDGRGAGLAGLAQRLGSNGGLQDLRSLLGRGK
jgi:hypothetical protein